MTPWTVAHQAPLSMGILQARTLEWVAVPSSRGSSQHRDLIRVVGGSLCSEPPGKPKCIITTLMAESEEELKSFLMKVKEEREKKSGLNSTFHVIWSHYFMANR